MSNNTCHSEIYRSLFAFCLSILLCFFLVACATSQEPARVTDYAIEFQSKRDTPVEGVQEIEALDCSFGVAGRFENWPGALPRKSYPDRNFCEQIQYAGDAAIPDYIYFKWRIIKSGEIFEDRVDVKELLPKHFSFQKLYIAIFGDKLNIYIFPNTNAPRTLLAYGKPPARIPGVRYDETFRDSEFAQKHLIYSTNR